MGARRGSRGLRDVGSDSRGLEEAVGGSGQWDSMVGERGELKVGKERVAAG